MNLDEIISGAYAPTGDGYPQSLKLKAPRITCADGTTLSVQASWSHYCQPRNDCGPYTHVEVGYPTTQPPETWAEYEDGNSGVYGFVPVQLVREYIALHGGELPGAA